MASVKPNTNKDGEIISYRWRACLGRDDLGNQKFATKTVPAPQNMTPGKALKEMKRQADSWEKGMKEGVVPVDIQSFRYFVQETWWKTHVLNGEHKPTTIDFYANMTVRLLDAFGSKDLTGIKASDIQQFLNSLRGQNLSSATIRHYYNLLGILFGYAEKFDHIERNPMLKIDAPKKDAHTVDFLTPEQAQQFIKALESAPLRWKTLMNVLISSGLRRGEVVGLKWEDVNLKEMTISVNRSVTSSKSTRISIGTPKSVNSIRTLPITPRLASLLKEWQSAQLAEWQGLTVDKKVTRMLMPSAYVFGSEVDPSKPMYPTSPTRWLSKFVKAHNLPNISPHDLRHTAGSLMLASGASIKDTQDYLGHEDAKTTLRFYAGTTPESLRKAADGLATLLEG